MRHVPPETSTDFISLHDVIFQEIGLFSFGSVSRDTILAQP
jgi:hypothetical protein